MVQLGDADRHIFCFGDFRFVPSEQSLWHRDLRLHVGSRALDLLHLLVMRAGEPVGKDELVAFAWPRLFVHDSNLKVNIAALRRALRDADPDLSPIATVPGRGYRFTAPLRVYGDDEALRDRARVPESGLPPAGPIVGRDDVIASLQGRLSECGFLTVVGPAGVGKTTVAAAVAAGLSTRYKDGVRFVDLAAISDPQLVGPMVAAALGISGRWTNILAGIVEALRDREILLLLDNCEHVLSTASAIAEHLRTAVQGVAIVATSREPLRARAESVYRLSPLQCPDDEGSVSQASALAFPAVELFVRRANEASGYEFKDEDAPTIAAICRRLDGIALAIELAAPRLESGDPGTLLTLLERSIDPLEAGPRDVSPRHRTLLATLDWSYRLLSRNEARLLRLLSVFTASFSLADVIGLAGDGAEGPDEVARWTEGLAVKSLLSVAYRPEGPLYRLLDMTRSFAGDRLARSGELGRAMAGYSRHILHLFEQAEAEWQWQPRDSWTAAYAHRMNDLRKAIEWAFGPEGDPEVGVRLTCAAIPLWDELSTVDESRSRVERALGRPDAVARCDPAVRMKLVSSYASGLNFSDNLGPSADAAWREAHQLARAVGNIDYQLRTLWGLGVLQSFTGRHQQALATLQQFVALAEREKEEPALADGARVELMAAFYCGDIAQAHKGLTALASERSASLRRTRIVRFQVDRFVSVRVALAMTAWVTGDHKQAIAVLGEALQRCAALGHVVSHSNALAQSALPLAMWSGDTRQAQEHITALARNLALREIAIWQPVCRFYRGAIASASGDASGVDRMRLAVEELISNNFLVRVPLYLAMLAEADLGHGQVALAHESLAAAFERSEQQDEHWSRPELLRVRALLQEDDGDLSGAAETLTLAMRSAEQSGALSFKLRSGIVLARLWRRSGQGAAAAAMLDPLYARFDPNSAAADVREARGLLESLIPERRSARSDGGD